MKYYMLRYENGDLYPSGLKDLESEIAPFLHTFDQVTTFKTRFTELTDLKIVPVTVTIDDATLDEFLTFLHNRTPNVPK